MYCKKNRDINSSFTVRKISFGEGVERTFALYSPIIGSIDVVRSGKVKRAKLYYLRDRKGKSARIAEKIKKKIGIDITPAPKQVLENATSGENVKKEIESLTFITFGLLIFDIEEVTTHPAPFFRASATYLLPSFFFPVIAKNKFSFLIDLVSIERPLKFTFFVFPITLLIKSLF